MTPETFLRMRALFDQAMTLAVEQRRAFLDREAPPGDPLRAQLQAMVEAGNDSAFLAEAARSGIPTDALPGRVPDPMLQISNYKVLREIARGGMGVVYLAVRNDDVFHKVVALKVIAGTVARDSDFVARFRQERQILAGLDHPNISRILDGGNTEDGLPFYVMEHVAGSPIDEYCARTRADVGTRVRMIIEVCQAVDYLHAHAVTHRDIKPSNILVADDGRVKLVDFGIAKVDTVAGLVASPSAPGQPTMIMTPGYASPEQLHGVASGKSGDIYSLGVVLYQLLTGRLPFADESGRPNLSAQLSGEEPPPPSKERKSGTDRVALPSNSWRISHPDLDRVVLTAIQRDPGRRYATVRAFADDLQRCLEGRAITARLESPTYRFRKLVGRNRLASALAVLLVLATGVGAWMAISLRIERVRLEAKEDELGRFVAMMDTRVQRWHDPAGVPVVEKVADVRAANDVMASDTVRTLSAKAPDPDRVKALIDELRTVIDRAERLSAGLVPLRKEIAIVYRQIGDFQATATRPQVADRAQAQVTYRRAATVVASVRKDEPQWAADQLSELGGRMEIVGARLEVAADPEPEPPPAAAPEPIPVEAPRVAKPRHVPVPLVAAATVDPAVDPAERAEAMQRLRSVSGNAEIAHRNLEALQNSLARSGQTVRGDLTTSMSRVDDLIEDARSALAADDLAGANESLNRAAYELRRLLQSVGG